MGSASLSDTQMELNWMTVSGAEAHTLSSAAGKYGTKNTTQAPPPLPTLRTPSQRRRLVGRIQSVRARLVPKGKPQLPLIMHQPYFSNR